MYPHHRSSRSQRVNSSSSSTSIHITTAQPTESTSPSVPHSLSPHNPYATRRTAQRIQPPQRSPPHLPVLAPNAQGPRGQAQACGALHPPEQLEPRPRGRRRGRARPPPLDGARRGAAVVVRQRRRRDGCLGTGPRARSCAAFAWGQDHAANARGDTRPFEIRLSAKTIPSRGQRKRWLVSSGRSDCRQSSV